MFGSTRRPGMRGHNSLTMGNLGSLSGTVFGDALPPMQTWWTVTQVYDGKTVIVGGGGSSETQAEIADQMRREGKVPPKYTVVFHASPQEQSTYQNKVRSGGTGSLLTAIDKTTSAVVPMSSTKKAAIVGGIALAAYFLLRK